MPVKGLAHSYGPVVGSIKGAAPSVDGSDARRGDAGRQYTSTEAVFDEARGKGGQDPDLVMAAIVHGLC